MRWTPAMSAKATLTPVFGSCIWIQIGFEIWILDLNYKISFTPSIHVYVHTLYSLEVKNDEKVCKECERDCVFSKSERLAEAALTTNCILAMPLCLLFVFIVYCLCLLGLSISKSEATYHKLDIGDAFVSVSRNIPDRWSHRVHEFLHNDDLTMR